MRNLGDDLIRSQSKDQGTNPSRSTQNHEVLLKFLANVRRPLMREVCGLFLVLQLIFNVIFGPSFLGPLEFFSFSGLLSGKSMFSFDEKKK